MTNYCTHTTDGTVCDECLGVNAEAFERKRDSALESVFEFDYEDIESALERAEQADAEKGDVIGAAVWGLVKDRFTRSAAYYLRDHTEIKRLEGDHEAD